MDYAKTSRKRRILQLRFMIGTVDRTPLRVERQPRTPLPYYGHGRDPLRLRLRLKAAVTSAVPMKRALASHEIVSSDSSLHLVASVCITPNTSRCLLCQENAPGERFSRCDVQGTPGVKTSSDRLRARLRDMVRGNGDSTQIRVKDSRGTKGKVLSVTYPSSIQLTSPSLLHFFFSTLFLRFYCLKSVTFQHSPCLLSPPSSPLLPAALL